MNLFTWGKQKETRVYDSGKPFPCDESRWALELTWFGIGIVHQYKYRDTQKWNSSHTTAYGLCLWILNGKKFRDPWYGVFGISHNYYDGPHCALNLGWLHIYWGGDPRTGWCKKCMPDNDC